jgi:hypothetical protein
MFCLSMIEHKKITAEMCEEAMKASIAYLECYFPKTLPKRRGANNQPVSMVKTVRKERVTRAPTS